MFAFAGGAFGASINISENTDPKITAIYNELKSSEQKLATLQSDYESDLMDNAAAMRQTENSAANKALGAASIGATAIGAGQLMQGLAEQSADERTAQSIAAHTATFMCMVSDGQQIQYDATGQTPAYPSDFTSLVSQYKKLAADLHATKTGLGLPPGLEAEQILDSAPSLLYDDYSVGRGDGIFDTAAERLASGESEQKINTGATIAGAGVLGGIVGNMIINKDAPAEKSREITREFESASGRLETEIKNKEAELAAAIDANAALVKKYNDLLAAHRAFAATITDADCAAQFAEYIAYINSLADITDNMADMSGMKIEYDLATQQAEYNKCVDAAVLARRRAECEQDTAKAWKDGQCVDRPVMPPAPTVMAPVTTVTAPDPDLCPATGNGLRSITDTTRVNDSCSSAFITSGVVVRRPDGKTCTCSAQSCVAGYAVTGGRCDKVVVNANAAAATTAPVAPPIDLKYFEVCNKDKGKSGGTEYCESELFNWTRVGHMQGVGLATEYARVRNGHIVKCAENYTSDNNIRQDHYIQCTSTDGKNFYEFKFDTLDATSDSTIHNAVMESVCAIHSVKFRETNGTAATGSSNQCETADKAKCDKINESFQRIGGFTTRIANNPAHAAHGPNAKLAVQTCVISTTAQMTETIDDLKLRTAFGIDNRGLRDSIQIKASPNLVTTLGKYSANQMNVPLTSFRCDSNPRAAYYTKGPFRETDEVLTCYPNNQPVDFLFDDLSESGRRINIGGWEGLECKITNGIYSGRSCHGLTSAQCVAIDNVMRQKFGSGGNTTYIAATGECILNNATLAANVTEDNMRLIGMAGSMLACAGTAAETSGTTCILAAVEIVSAAAEQFTANDLRRWPDEFFVESRACIRNKTAGCAESVTRKHLGRLLKIMDNHNLAEANKTAIPREFLALMDQMSPDTINGIMAVGEDCGTPEQCSDDQLMAKYDLYFDSTVSGRDNTIIWANKIAFWGQLTSVGAMIGTGLFKAGLRARLAIRSARAAPRAATAVANIADDVVRSLPRSTIKNIADRQDELARIANTPNSSTRSTQIRQTINTNRNTLRNAGFTDAEIDAAVVEFKANPNAYPPESVVPARGAAPDAPAPSPSNTPPVQSAPETPVPAPTPATSSPTTAALNNKIAAWGKVNSITVNDDIAKIEAGMETMVPYRNTTLTADDIALINGDIGSRGMRLWKDPDSTDDIVYLMRNPEPVPVPTPTPHAIPETPQAPTPVLSDTGSFFNKTYNNMTDQEFGDALRYLDSIQDDPVATFRYLESSGIYDPRKATNLASDLRDELSALFKADPNIADGINNWHNLDMNARKGLVEQLNHIIGGTRRQHAGNTIINFDESDALASFTRETPWSPKKFAYNLDALARNDFDEMLNTLVHENTHGFQYAFKSSIQPEFILRQRQARNLIDENLYQDQFYQMNVIEQEAYRIGYLVSDGFSAEFRAVGGAKSPVYSIGYSANNVAGNNDRKFAAMLSAHGGPSGDIPGFSSAYHPELAKVSAHYDDMEKAEFAAIRQKYPGITDTDPRYDDYINELADANDGYNQIRILEFADAAPLNQAAVSEFAERMAENVDNILRNSGQASVFDSLDRNQIQDFAQEVVDQLSVRYGMKKGDITVVCNEIGDVPGYYNDGIIHLSRYADNTGTIEFQDGIHTLDGFGNTIAHEFVHAIDDIAPEYGIIGSQRAAYGNRVYTNARNVADNAAREIIYMDNFTEQAAYPVGDKVGEVIRNSLYSQ